MLEDSFVMLDMSGAGWVIVGGIELVFVGEAISVGSSSAILMVNYAILYMQTAI